MNLNTILQSLENCPCGRKHTFDVRRIEIGRGLVGETGRILKEENFPSAILLVCDRNTLAAASGILSSLDGAGFEVYQWIYPDLKYAKAEEIRRVEMLSENAGAILSVGTGSLNDICRVAAYEKKKRFCIFATAPSMDGFASDTASIVEDGFKTSWQAAQPEVIIGDTEILARAPQILKSSGFGDMMAKYVGLADWRIAKLLINEYYCDKVAGITEEATGRIVSLADRITSDDPETAGAVLEALILTGLAMKLAGCSRPASGAEHVVSHYLECHKLLRGIWPEYHGRKVGVAALLCTRLYRNVAERVTEVDPIRDPTDFSEVYAHYDPRMHEGVRRMNEPTKITDLVDPADLKAKWPHIRQIILETLPESETLEDLMKRAGAATGPEEINVSPDFLDDAVRYHPYMRRRLLLTGLMPMLRIDPAEYLN